ncbi:hypothetical protein [Nostoc sp.]|uniref:hypothetical protein n=1 Tax=Nostoc sp. TaxID=1180 RepID=UPI002FF93921
MLAYARHPRLNGAPQQSCSKFLAIWHHNSLNCGLNEISTQQNSHKSPKLTQRCRTQQLTHSAWSSQLLETLRERHNWLVMY